MQDEHVISGVARAYESFSRGHDLGLLVQHALAVVHQQTDSDGYVVAAEREDLLRGSILFDREALLLEVPHESAVALSNGNVEDHAADIHRDYWSLIRRL